MPTRRKSPAKRLSNRFYSSAKISEYQFKRVLWSFVRDVSETEAARGIALSANSIGAIYGKLRSYFTTLGVFVDIYGGGDPREGTSRGEDGELYEHRLIGFHLKRIRAKRRVRDTELDEIDYHWCESGWRFGYSILTEDRASEIVERMMFAHLMAHIRLCGPIGRAPAKLEESRQLAFEQRRQRLLWLERNAPAFREEHVRAAFRESRTAPFDPDRDYLA